MFCAGDRGILAFSIIEDLLENNEPDTEINSGGASQHISPEL